MQVDVVDGGDNQIIHHIERRGIAMRIAVAANIDRVATRFRVFADVQPRKISV